MDRLDTRSRSKIKVILDHPSRSQEENVKTVYATLRDGVLILGVCRPTAWLGFDFKIR